MKKSVRIQLSIMMFIQFFVWGTWYVTMGSYLGELGFSGSDIGNAYSTTAIAAIISPLFVGMIADKFFSAQKVLGILHLLGAACLYWATTVTTPTAFYWALLTHTIFYMPTIALANSVSFHKMTEPEKEFPQIRVLGTIGWIATGLLISTLDGMLDFDVEKSALPFQIGAAAGVLMGIYSFTLPDTPPQSKGEKKSVAELLGLDAVKLMSNRSFAVLIIGSFLISIPLSFYFSFGNMFLNEAGMEYTASKMSLGQVSEIVFMLLMPFFFKRLGVKKMILIAMVAWGLRYVLFAFGDNTTMVWMFYGGILLHGICYDFFFVTGQIYVDNKAPASMRSNAQGFITLVTYGFGMYVGTILSGKVVEHYTLAENSHQWFDIWMVPAAIAGVVLILFAVFFKDDYEVN